MKTNIYIVILSRDSWWIDLDGESEGPFGSLEAAIEHATELAEGVASGGGRSEVRVIGPGHDNTLIYQSAKKSILGRAIAAAHPADS